jgi:hypothetical protein
MVLLPTWWQTHQATPASEEQFSLPVHFCKKGSCARSVKSFHLLLVANSSLSSWNHSLPALLTTSSLQPQAPLLLSESLANPHPGLSVSWFYLEMPPRVSSWTRSSRFKTPLRTRMYNLQLRGWGLRNDCTLCTFSTAWNIIDLNTCHTNTYCLPIVLLCPQITHPLPKLQTSTCTPMHKSNSWNHVMTI